MPRGPLISARLARADPNSRAVHVKQLVPLAITACSVVWAQSVDTKIDKIDLQKRISQQRECHEALR
jgi:hypothetical protein